MIVEKRVYLAVDTAYAQGMVVLMSDEDVIFEFALHEKMLHGQLICHAIESATSFCRQRNFQLAGIFCGLGPGSFVGVRIALATSLGFSFSLSLPLMGFCSHEALAHTHEDKNHFIIFMKASGDLGYCSRYQNTGGKIEMISCNVIPIDQLVSDISSKEIIYSDVDDRVRALNGVVSQVTNIRGPSSLGIYRAAISRLNQVGSFVDESATIQPNYMKAPNVTLATTRPNYLAN